MSNVFGLDINDLNSVFDDSESKTIEIEQASNSQDNKEKNHDFEKKKRKAEEGLKEHINVTSEDDAFQSKRSKLTSDMESTLSKSPRIMIYKIPSPDTCTHEVAYPPDIPFKNLAEATEPKIRTFAFTLDAFQQQALLCVDNNQSVMVSAHTSAGKTVVAEYAIAKALKEKQRVIYTTPIKALSNQKYREFSEEFPEVGLLTGDATINPNASVLIMTTEILQSMLYRGASLMREVGWVIFDEIHYMRDPERGVVWEETLVLLSDSVRCVFLSATAPNARQFAEWIAFLHNQPCHVVCSNARPVPLRHYFYPLGSEGLHLVLDEGRFIEENFQKAFDFFENEQQKLQQQKAPDGGRRLHLAQPGGPSSKRTEQDVTRMVRLVKHRNLEPIIVFSFSKKECEIYALQLSECDFNSEAEKMIAEEVFNNAIGGLSPEDRKLPQISNVLPLLKKGIGIHHGGLLPILKETVEILFSEGLVKCLFATETFAMGLNMPARTVMFTSARKYDGVTYRAITAGEYIQMSGRAGRRGKDASGTVIMMLDDSMTRESAHSFLQGDPAPLNSAFHITYNMLLNLLRVEEINPEYLMERSFCQFQNYAILPQLYKELMDIQTEYNSAKLEDEESVESYQRINQCLRDVVDQQWNYVRRPEYIVSFLQPGRLIKVRTNGEEYGWGVVINLKKRHRKDRVSASETFYIIDCLLANREESVAAAAAALMSSSSTASSSSTSAAAAVVVVPENAEILPVRLDCVCGISAVRLMVPPDLRNSEARNNLFASIGKVQAKLGSTSLPQLDPIKDMHIRDAKFKEITQKVKAFEERLAAHWLTGDPRLASLLAAYERREAQRLRVDELTSLLSRKVSLIKMQELAARKRVLRRLGFLNDRDVIELKGRVACEISSADELVLTELLFEGIFNRLAPEHIAALLSCFVFEERCQDMPNLNRDLSDALRTLQETARRVARISNECRLPVDADAYVDSFKPHIMDLVVAWCNGTSFASICADSNLFEGTIIRSLRLLEELLRQMTNVARTIGNAALEVKFNEAIEKIKRDIVFAPSLYL